MVWRRRSAQAVSSQGQKSSSWVNSGGTRSKKRRRALWHLERLQESARARRRMHSDTYSVRSRWHISSTLQALAASRHRFTCVTSFSEPVGPWHTVRTVCAALLAAAPPLRPSAHPAPVHGRQVRHTCSTKAAARLECGFALRVLAGPNPLSTLIFSQVPQSHTRLYPRKGSLQQARIFNKMNFALIWASGTTLLMQIDQPEA